MTEEEWIDVRADFLARPDTVALSKSLREKGVRLALAQAAWHVGQHTVDKTGDLSLKERFFRVAIETLGYLEANPKLIQETPEWKHL